MFYLDSIVYTSPVNLLSTLVRWPLLAPASAALISLITFSPVTMSLTALPFCAHNRSITYNYTKYCAYTLCFDIDYNTFIAVLPSPNRSSYIFTSRAKTSPIRSAVSMRSWFACPARLRLMKSEHVAITSSIAAFIYSVPLVRCDILSTKSCALTKLCMMVKRSLKVFTRATITPSLTLPTLARSSVRTAYSSVLTAAL